VFVASLSRSSSPSSSPSSALYPSSSLLRLLKIRSIPPPPTSPPTTAATAISSSPPPLIALQLSDTPLSSYADSGTGSADPAMILNSDDVMTLHNSEVSNAIKHWAPKPFADFFWRMAWLNMSTSLPQNITSHLFGVRLGCSNIQNIRLHMARTSVMSAAIRF
jgi:hypothetical protein